MGSVQPTIALSFLAGLVSVLSPCVFPLIPAFAAYMGGTSLADAEKPRLMRRLLPRSLAFVAGFSCVFMVLYYVLEALEVSVFVKYQRWFSLVAGLIVLAFAVTMLSGWRPKWSLVEWKPFQRSPSRTLMGGFLLGIAFALGWTPCLGPELGAILQLSLVGFGGLPFLLFYCVGLGLPFIAIALLSVRFAPLLTRLNRHARAVQRVSGALLAVFAVVLIFDKFSFLASLSQGSPFNLLMLR